jgi:hypothetical protein
VARGHIPHEFGTKQGVKSSSVRERSLPLSIRNHPQAECIRKYALALGLTTQEQMALCDNPALLMHTMAMEKSVNQDETFIDRFMKKRKEDSIKKGVEEQCIIS